MKDFAMQFPIWFWMPIIVVIVGAIAYRLVKKGVRIKVGSVEIDAEDDITIEAVKKD